MAGRTLVDKAAECAARGMGATQTAKVCGCSRQRVYQLRKDPGYALAVEAWQARLGTAAPTKTRRAAQQAKPLTEAEQAELAAFVDPTGWRDHPVPMVQGPEGPVIDEAKLARWARYHVVPYAILSTDGEWERATHLLYLADMLMRVYDRESPETIPRLCISFPPGHGKSWLMSVAFPQFWLGNRPKERVVVCAYNLKLAKTFGGEARLRFIETASKVWPGVTTPKLGAADEWYTEVNGKRGGYMICVGVDGPLTGRRGECIIIDDVFKGDKDANSPTQRQGVTDWLLSVPLTRFPTHKPGRAVILSTRWHHDDHIGQLEQRQAAGEVGHPWEFYNLPAIALDNDPMGRQEGEALWPECWPVERLELERKEKGPHVWQCLYMGRPTPAEGGFFKKDWFKRYRRRDDGAYVLGSRVVENLAIYAVGDLAVSTRDYADYSAIGIFGIDVEGGNLVVIDMIRARLDGPAILAKLDEVNATWQPNVVYVEKTAYALHLIQVAKESGLPIRWLHADRDKVSRAQVATADAENGRLWLPVDSPWLYALESELLAFPHGAHDDQVDVISYGVKAFRANMKARNTPRPPGLRLGRM